jgi:hypothetical protein|nr:MAG: hypothetical protein TU36_02425 [Vulcanisaeta sp. AZ3]
MSSNEEFIPHAIYTWFGLLKSRNSVVTKEEGAKFSPFAKDTENRLRDALSSFGWVYCVDCRQPLFTLEEALEHSKRGHLLTNMFMPDEVAPEEVPMVG